MTQTDSRHFSRIAIVRLMIFFFVLLAGYALLQLGIIQTAKHVPAADRDLAIVGAAVVGSLLMVGLYALLVHWLERRRAKELRPATGVPLLLAGLLLALVFFCIIYGVFLALGVAQYRGVSGFGHVMPFVAMAIASGVVEELIFRGGVYRVLEDGLGTGWALVLSGALFGGLHLVNQNATLFGALAIALEAGVLLGAAYTYTRNLWLPIGIHMGWNFAEGGVFGAAVSGSSRGGDGILNMPLAGPDLLTGGQFGPEASLVTLVVCTLAGLAFIVLTIRKGHWVPRSFNMMLD